METICARERPTALRPLSKCERRCLDIQEGARWTALVSSSASKGFRTKERTLGVADFQSVSAYPLTKITGRSGRTSYTMEASSIPVICGIADR
jgi:hypothetical protein